MITKGDLVHQQRKAETSGIDHHFEFIHVVVDKEPDAYRQDRRRARRAAPTGSA